MQTKHFAFAEVKAAESENPSGEFEAVLSVASLDRDGEVIESKAFEPLPAHITIDVDHGLSAATTVGSGQPFYDGDTLKIRGTFASRPLAQEIRSLVSEGHIRHMSVAFMGAEKDRKDSGPTTITKAELLNAAFVAVPSNRDAVVLSAKGLDLKVGARNSATDAARMQQIHDLAVENGAGCSTKAATLAAPRATPGVDPLVDPVPDPSVSLQAADAALDEALALFATASTDALPAEVQQAIALLQAADAAMDDALAALNVPDPDEAGTRSAAADAAAIKAAAPAAADEIPPEAMARLEIQRAAVAVFA